MAKEKVFNGYKVDKENADVIFSDEEHVYLGKEDGQQYVSVTSVIGLYGNKFDSDFWSSYKALEAILDQETWQIVRSSLLNKKRFNPNLIKQLHVDEEEFLTKKAEILEGYDKSRIESCERGTKIHKDLEESLYNNKFNFNQLGFEEFDRNNYLCKRDYYELDITRGIYPEFLISVKSRDGALRLSGQIDLLIIDGNNVTLVDWKTNKELKKEGYYDKVRKKKQTLKYPLSHLDDCNFNTYQLQLSTYAYMLQTLKPELNIEKLLIYHINHDGEETLHECKYLKKEVIRMLNHYKKTKKIQRQLDKIKPVVYG